MSAAARYHARAPRYVFRPEDESLARFAGLNEKGATSRARVHDLSASGLSFIVDSFDAPVAGDMLKIEFDVPGQRQMAWFATVVRVEHRTDWDPDFGERTFTLVGLRFRQLPEPFRKAIQSSVVGRLHHNEESEALEKPESARAAMAFLGLTLALLVCLYWMALPIETVAGLFK